MLNRVLYSAMLLLISLGCEVANASEAKEYNYHDCNSTSTPTVNDPTSNENLFVFLLEPKSFHSGRFIAYAINHDHLVAFAREHDLKLRPILPADFKSSSNHPLETYSHPQFRKIIFSNGFRSPFKRKSRNQYAYMNEYQQLDRVTLYESCEFAPWRKKLLSLLEGKEFLVAVNSPEGNDWLKKRIPRKDWAKLNTRYKEEEAYPGKAKPAITNEDEHKVDIPVLTR